MNEERYDGTEKQTNDATPEQILAAVRDVEVKRVTVYKPGDIVQLRTATYRIGPKGNWIRVSK